MSRTKGFVSTGEMAKVLGCTPRTVQGYCEAGLFPGARKLPGGRGDWRIPKKIFQDATGGKAPEEIAG